MVPPAEKSPWIPLAPPCCVTDEVDPGVLVNAWSLLPDALDIRVGLEVVRDGISGSVSVSSRGGHMRRQRVLCSSADPFRVIPPTESRGLTVRARPAVFHSVGPLPSGCLLHHVTQAKRSDEVTAGICKVSHTVTETSASRSPVDGYARARLGWDRRSSASVIAGWRFVRTLFEMLGGRFEVAGNSMAWPVFLLICCIHMAPESGVCPVPDGLLVIAFTRP